MIWTRDEAYVPFLADHWEPTGSSAWTSEPTVKAVSSREDTPWSSTSTLSLSLLSCESLPYFLWQSPPCSPPLVPFPIP